MDFPEKIYTVTRLTEEIKDLLEEEFPFLWLEGEISNFRIPPSGHCYFTLKDAASQIRAVFFKSGQSGLSFRPENGLQVLCFGRLSVYAGRGEYQIIIERMELKGWGALQLAFEKLKERLFKEGLFDPGRKKPMPLLPGRVAVVTSPTGAVIQDFLRILYRRFRNIRVYIYPVLVQGEAASFEIEEAIRDLNRSSLGIEVIVLARGGGSLEDLWPFNEERVARAIAASSIPVLSAIGHEVDFTIADFTADLRASTPSAAAELLIQPQAEWESRIRELRDRLVQQVLQKTDLYEEKLFHFQKRIGDPRRRLIDLFLRLDDYGIRLRLALRGVLGKKLDTLGWIQEKLLIRNPQDKILAGNNRLEIQKLKIKGLMSRRLEQTQMVLKSQNKTLQALSPWGVLDRGYALVRTLPELSLVKKVEDAHPGQEIRVFIAHGEMDCLVEQTRKKEEGSFVQGAI
ncbi:MAG: exodeoxyribonuclease VII large subunit [Deltaproteobacteria bacterium RBG_13_43_22]|nr:MAG: exodeoxyribonuclease VII large subunit [Deltaproteobacteria bacterium RBG_13_43_22]